MPDKIFSDTKLAAIYDAFDGERTDLPHYEKIAEELKAHSILDVGCGTGCLASRLYEKGYTVTGLDPAKASLEIARNKVPPDAVQWILGDTGQLSDMEIETDLVFMTGNVAQVFLSDEEWTKTLRDVHQVLTPNGHFVFETRDPGKKAWKNWSRDETWTKLQIENVGTVEGWCEVLSEGDQTVTFRWHYLFHSDSQLITSDSTLRFREKEQVINSLRRTGFVVEDIREAPDRPGKEFVFIARKAPKTRLFHVSENPSIETFEPLPAPNPDAGVEGTAVWAVDESHLVNYLLPRDCPRVTYAASPMTSLTDRERFFSKENAHQRMVIVENAWLERVKETILFLYELDPKNFQWVDSGAGYLISRKPEKPLSCRPVSQLIEQIHAKGALFETRENLWPLIDEVSSSSLEFSIIRSRNAQPRGK